MGLCLDEQRSFVATIQGSSERTIIDDPTYDRMGINLRLFDAALWEKLPRRFIDGASY